MNATTANSIAVDYRSGELIFGSHDDVPVGYGLYDQEQGLMCSGAILGRVGTGKTSLLRGIANAVTTTGHTQVWTGQAYAHEWSLTGAFYRAVGVDSVRLMLTAATDLLTARRRDTKHRRRFTPSPEQSGVLILLDDAGDLLRDDEIVSMINRIADDGPTVGVAIITATNSSHSVYSLRRRQSITLGNPLNHHWPMPPFNTDRPYDGHIVTSDVSTTTVTPFDFNWQS